MTRNTCSPTPFRLGLRNHLPEQRGLDPYANRALDKIENAFVQRRWPGPAPAPAPQKQSKAKSGSDSTGATSTPSGGTPGNGANVMPLNNQLLIDLLRIRPINDLIEAMNNQRQGETLEALVDAAQQRGRFADVQSILESEYVDSFNRISILEREGIVYYLYVYADLIEGLKEPAAIARWIGDEEDGGCHQIYTAVMEMAVHDYEEREKVDIDDRNAFHRYLNSQIAGSRFSFRDRAFQEVIGKLVRDFAFDNDNFQLIDNTANGLGIQLTKSQKQYLNQYIKQSSIKIDANNAPFFLSQALNQFSNRTLSINGTGSSTSPLDFSVDYYEDSEETLSINTENILAAGQLFYSMTLGDELGLFDAADLLITKYMTNGDVDIRNNETLFYLQQYAFGEEFTDPKSGEVFKRTMAEERQMFYRQVFDLGDGAVMEGAVYNSEFGNLWYNFITEVGTYIQQLGESENPIALVSRQYVAQAIEDLRYNLSNHCTGMAKAISPIIKKELDFVVRRFFQDDEIIQQLALHNSQSFLKVPERILQDRDRKPVKLKTSFDRARFGHMIFERLAGFTAAMVDDDEKFTEFISIVDRYIALYGSEQKEASRRSDLPEDRNFPGEEFVPSGMPGMPANSGGNGNQSNSNDDWSF